MIVPGTSECGVCFYCSIGRPDQCSETFDRGGIWPHVANRRNGAAGQRGRQRRRLRRGDERHGEPGLPGAERPAGRVAQPARLRDHDRARRGLQRRQGAGRARASRSSGSATSGSGWCRRRRSRGAPQIIAVDPIAERRELAGQLGATAPRRPRPRTTPWCRCRRSPRGAAPTTCSRRRRSRRPRPQAILMSRRAGTVVLTSVERARRDGDRPTGRDRGAEPRDPQRPERQRPHAPRPAPLHPDDGGRAGRRPSRSSRRRYSLDEINDALHASAEKRDLSGVIVPNG